MNVGYPLSPGDIVVVEAVVHHVGVGPFADEVTIRVRHSEDVLGLEAEPLLTMPTDQVRRKITAYTPRKVGK